VRAAGDDDDKAPKPKRELTAYNLFIQVSTRRALAACNEGALTHGASDYSPSWRKSRRRCATAQPCGRALSRARCASTELRAVRVFACGFAVHRGVRRTARAYLIGRPSCPNWPPTAADARHAARCCPRQHPELTHTEAFAQAAHAVRSLRCGVVGTAPPGVEAAACAAIARPRLA